MHDLDAHIEPISFILPASANMDALAKSAWFDTALVPRNSGFYELHSPIAMREHFLLYWNGRLWLDAAGAAVSGLYLQSSLWRGLTRTAYENACCALGVPAIAQYQIDRRINLDRRHHDRNESDQARGRRADDRDLFSTF